MASVISYSVRPHRQQPTRLLCPWDSPGKNTGVGCHFLLQCMKVKSESEVAQLCPTLSNPMDCSLPGSSIHGIFQARVLEWGAIAFSKVKMVEKLFCVYTQNGQNIKKKKKFLTCRGKASVIWKIQLLSNTTGLSNVSSLRGIFCLCSIFTDCFCSNHSYCSKRQTLL